MSCGLLPPAFFQFLRRFIGEKRGLLFATRNGTPHLHNNIEERWLTKRLKKMGQDEPGMGWHAFRRFRKTWLRGKRCQENINIFWMGHKPKTAEPFGFGFEVPQSRSEKLAVAPIAPKVDDGLYEEVTVSVWW